MVIFNSYFDITRGYPGSLGPRVPGPSAASKLRYSVFQGLRVEHQVLSASAALLAPYNCQKRRGTARQRHPVLIVQ